MSGWINRSMKGLLIKDIKLMKNQKQFFAVLIFCALGFMNLFEPDFLVTYISFMCTFFVLSTISYDEYDNGNAFLFSLPITRKDYVVEKYLFGTGFGVISWLAAVVVATIQQMWKNPDFSMADWLITACILFLPLLIFMAVMLPIQLKFGGEKGRMVMIMIYGGFAAAVVLIAKAVTKFQVDLSAVFEWLDHLNKVSGAMIALLLSAGVLYLSFVVSIRIVEKKEF